MCTSTWMCTCVHIHVHVVMYVCIYIIIIIKERTTHPSDVLKQQGSSLLVSTDVR